MGTAICSALTHRRPSRRAGQRSWLGAWGAALICGAALLMSVDAQARVNTDAARSDEIVKLHLPVNLEGRQTIRLQRLVDEYYDIDLDDYVLREVVLETDGASNRANAFARLQVGRYRTGRIHIDDNLTSLEAPGVHHSNWRLQLGSGVRAHGILLVLSERSYRSYRNYSTLPHSGATHGLGWYLGSRDYYYHDRFARPHFYNRYHRDHHGHRRGVWRGDYRRGYRDGQNHRQQLLRQRRAQEQHQRALRQERRAQRDRRKQEQPHTDRKRDTEHRQWRGGERRASVQRQARIRQARPDRVQQRRVTVERPKRDAQRAQPRIRSSRDQPRSSVKRSDRSTPRTRVRQSERVR